MPSSSINGSALRGVRVLVVEDDADARELLEEFLSHEGAEVETAGDARRGFAAIERFAPDVLLSDIGLPGEDGYSLMRRCRKQATEAVRRTPAVAVTAWSRPQDVDKSREAGFDAHLPKPLDLGQVTSTILRLARKASAADKPC